MTNATNIFLGQYAFAKAKAKARYGHRDWVVWGEGNKQIATPKTRESIKAAMLATGTQKHFYLACGDGVDMIVSWRIGATMLSNAKYEL